MAEVKWIKLATNIFDNKKIKKLRRLPSGNNLLLIWIMLLTLAGKCNNNGMIYITETLPYTDEDLADELGFDVPTLKLATDALLSLGMISIDDKGFITVSGWEEHQNIEGLDKIRESKRLAQAKWRAKQKALSEKSVVDTTVDSTKIKNNNAEVEVDEEEEKERRIRLDTTAVAVVEEENDNGNSKNGEEKNSDDVLQPFKGLVMLSENQIADLLDKMGLQAFDYYIDKLSNFISEKNANVKNHYATILKWYREDTKIEGD